MRHAEPMRLFVVTAGFTQTERTVMHFAAWENDTVELQRAYAVEPVPQSTR